MPEQSGLRLLCPTKRRICPYAARRGNGALCRARYHKTRFLVVGQHRLTKSRLPSTLSSCMVSQMSSCMVSQMCSPTLTRSPCEGCRTRVAQISEGLLLRTPKPPHSRDSPQDLSQVQQLSRGEPVLQKTLQMRIFLMARLSSSHAVGPSSMTNCSRRNRVTKQSQELLNLIRAAEPPL